MKIVQVPCVRSGETVANRGPRLCGVSLEGSQGSYGNRAFLSSYKILDVGKARHLSSSFCPKPLTEVTRYFPGREVLRLEFSLSGQ